MQTIIEIVRKTEAYFKGKGIEEARLNAELLIAWALGLKRLELYLQYDRPLIDEELDKLRPLVRRRGVREPLQYIEGKTEFYNCSLKVDSRCLIPRPETEELIEWVFEDMKGTSPTRILDLGTGTGAIAISLALAFPNAEIVAVDQSEDSLALAFENVKGNGVDSRVKLIQSNWFDQVEGVFDLIISNPPYLTQKEVDEAQPEVKDYEPIQALVSSDSGFADIQRILDHAFQFAKEGAKLFLETGIDHAPRLMKADPLHYSNLICKNDLSGRHRFFSAIMNPA
jgi:release factor glutamine methyltransferase